MAYMATNNSPLGPDPQGLCSSEALKVASLRPAVGRTGLMALPSPGNNWRFLRAWGRACPQYPVHRAFSGRARGCGTSAWLTFLGNVLQQYLP